MTKYCTACGRNVELVKDELTGNAYFNIVQATTIKIREHGGKSAKRQSTTYLCQECLETGRIKWSQLIQYLWVDGVIKLE